MRKRFLLPLLVLLLTTLSTLAYGFRASDLYYEITNDSVKETGEEVLHDCPYTVLSSQHMETITTEETLDTIRISVAQPDYLAYDEESGMWLYEGSAKINNVRYMVFLNWYTYSKDMTGTFTGSDIDDYTYNQGGIVVNHTPRLITEVYMEVASSRSDRDTTIHIDAIIKGWGPTSTTPVIYLCDLNWSRRLPKDTIEHVVPNGEFDLTNSDSTIFRGKANNGWSTSLCYDSYIKYTGERVQGHVFDKNTYLAYLQDTITPLYSPIAMITLDEHRMYHLYAEIFGTDENLHVIKLDAQVPAPIDTVELLFETGKLYEKWLPEEWGIAAFANDYDVEIYMSTSEVASGTYVGDQAYGYITVCSPSGTCDNYNSVFTKVVLDARNMCTPYFVTAYMQGEDGIMYHIIIDSVAHQPQYFVLDVLSSDTEKGSVQIVQEMDCDSVAIISATANFGYHFTRWNDGNKDNPRTVLVKRDTTFTAEFAMDYSGKCGDDLYWAYSNKEVKITGTGAMYNYTDSTMPWTLLRDSIKIVRVANTATSIGEYAFANTSKLAELYIGTNVEDIGANAFTGCRRLYDIYCYPIEPPFAETNSFANYNVYVYVYVPCENQRDYTLDVVWGEFKFIECIGSEVVVLPDDEVIVAPNYEDATFTWPVTDGADTYALVITKDDITFCTLVFNAQGQLVSIAFKPRRQNAPAEEDTTPATYAEMTANGFRFTVTGLDEGAAYAYTFTVRNAANSVLETYTGEFTTLSNTPTAISNSPDTTETVSDKGAEKLLRNGQVLILRNGETYDMMGQRL